MSPPLLDPGGRDDGPRWTLFEQHHDAVRRYVARRVEPAAVDDLVAETFAVAWRRLPRETDEPLPWLYAVARKVVHGHRRSTARRSALSVRAQRLAADRTDAGDPADRLPGDPVLARAWATLSTTEREALALVVWERLDHAEAARAAGCRPGTFAVRLNRARRRLRDALEPEPDPGAGRRRAPTTARPATLDPEH
ncbi:RNA polymerase sigma factor [Patulibacter brassicae]|uniref:RNA polymerase sigma factor n=1 Tax=Patulibacter brassicae TaxID=1705717 RepID=A0ABU4VL30_9ACTN|nr:RNA polymerase sigma factor [Patulibacter brassicae]MDX8152530.1 RNA polymerase sigma factor [Patulibacter brassicae]